MSSGPYPPLPTQLGGFEVIRRLGAGGMAEVFLAKKRGAEGTYKILVVKRILPAHGASRRFRSMFVDEAQLATRLNHPNIVQVYEFSDDGDEGLLLAMEYVEGSDLGQLMSARASRRRRASRRGSARASIAEAREGPALRARAQGRRRGARSTSCTATCRRRTCSSRYEGAVKIADFGIATRQLFRDEAGVLKGKFGYMSPEQARGEKVDRRSDIYALGVIFWHELLTRPPACTAALGGDSAARHRALGRGRAAVSTYARDVPHELEAIVMRALAPSRDDRFQTARDMVGRRSRARCSREQELVDAASRRSDDRAARPRATRPARGGAAAVRGRDSLAAQPQAIGARPATLARAARHGARLRADAEPTVRATRATARASSRARCGTSRSSPCRLHGVATLERWVGQAARGARGRQIRAMLGDIAYKRGVRCVGRPTRGRARDRRAHGEPARAPRPTPRGSRSTCTKRSPAPPRTLPSPVRASIGIVRGIASGERDRAGSPRAPRAARAGQPR